MLEDYKMLSRLKSTQEGLDFIDFLGRLSKQNYEGFKRSSSDMNDIYKGQALALDGLLDLFKDCDEKIKVNEIKTNTEWL